MKLQTKKSFKITVVWASTKVWVQCKNWGRRKPNNSFTNLANRPYFNYNSYCKYFLFMSRNLVFVDQDCLEKATPAKLIVFKWSFVIQDSWFEKYLIILEQIVNNLQLANTILNFDKISEASSSFYILSSLASGEWQQIVHFCSIQ